MIVYGAEPDTRPREQRIDAAEDRADQVWVDMWQEGRLS